MDTPHAHGLTHYLVGRHYSQRRAGYGYDERIEVMGSVGLVESRRQSPGNVALYSAEGIMSAALHGGWFDRVQPTCAAALTAFVDALVTGSPAPAPLRDGLKAQMIAEAATAPQSSGKTEPISHDTSSAA